MNKFLTMMIVVLLPLTLRAALTINNGGGATNITSTSAWITATVASTGAANPVLFSYWGTNDGSTNVSGWLNTNSFGVSTQAAYSFQATGLSGSTIYYFRAYATNSSETNWASYSSQFITLTTPTSAPPSSVQTVTVDTNDVLKHPTNFFLVNSNLIKTAIGYSSDTDTNATWGNITGTLSNQTDLQLALDGKSSSIHTQDWSTITGTPDTITGYGITDAYTKVESDAAYATTGTVGAIQVRTTAWDTASTDASSATGSIVTIQASTTLWNTAATDSGIATQYIGTNTLRLDLTTHTTNIIIHVTAIDKTNWDGKVTLGTVQAQGYLTNGDNLGNHYATQMISWAGSVYSNVTGTSYTYSVSNLTLTSTDAVPTGVASAEGIVYTNTVEINGYPAWTMTNGWYALRAADEGDYYIATNPAPEPITDFCYWRSGNLIGAYNPYESCTGTITAAYSAGDITNIIGTNYTYTLYTNLWQAGSDGTNWVVSLNGVAQFNATNLVSYSATRMISWPGSMYAGTNLILTSTDAVPAGVASQEGIFYTRCEDINAHLTWAATNGCYVWMDAGVYYVSSGYNNLSQPYWTAGSGDPIGVYSSYGGATGSITVAYNVLTNILQAGSDGTNWVVRLNGTNQFSATNVASLSEFLALSNQVRGITNGAALGETAVQPAFTNGWEVGPHTSLLATNGSGAGLTDITAAQVGAVATNVAVVMGTNAIVMGTNLIGLYGGNLNGTNGLYFIPNGSTNTYWILGGP
jgi:hypothetical protein